MPKLGKVVDYRWVPNEDHVICKASGGRDDSTNVVATHAHCNSKKGNLPPPEHEFKYLAMCQVDSRVIDAAAYAIAMMLHNDDPVAAKVPRNLEFL